MIKISDSIHKCDNQQANKRVQNTHQQGKCVINRCAFTLPSRNSSLRDISSHHRDVQELFPHRTQMKKASDRSWVNIIWGNESSSPQLTSKNPQCPSLRLTTKEFLLSSGNINNEALKPKWFYQLCYRLRQPWGCFPACSTDTKQTVFNSMSLAKGA